MNADKLIMKFQPPEKSIDKDNGPTRLVLMKLCNDERAYLDYKNRKIKFGSQIKKKLDDEND